MKIEVREITPAEASRMLSHNGGNRDLRDSVVERYVRLMKAGEWKLTHQGVAFDTTGSLVDGQHRLSAIVRSGVTVQMTVATDVDPATFTVLDQGAKRNAADILRVSPRIAELVNFAARVYTHEPTPSPATLQRMLDVVGPYAEDIQATHASHAVFFASAAFKLGAIIRMMLGDDRDYILKLYAKLCQGEVAELPPVGQAIVKLRLRSKVTATAKIDSLAYGLYVFDRRNERSSQIRADMKGAGDLARTVLGARFGSK